MNRGNHLILTVVPNRLVGIELEHVSIQFFRSNRNVYNE